MAETLTTTRLGLLGDCFIYAAPAIRSNVCRHSVTLACALTDEPLTVAVGAQQWQGRMLAVRPFVERTMSSNGRPAVLIDLEPLHPRYSAFSRPVGAEPVQMLDDQRFAGLTACAQAFALHALTGRQLHAAVQLQVGQLADSLGRHEAPDPRVLQMMAALRLDPGLSLAALGKPVGISATHASRSFVEALGITVRQYALSVKIQRAAGFYGSGRALTDVAQIAGFTDSAHLAKVWRRCYGGSPSLYFGEHRSAADGRVEHAWRQQVRLEPPLRPVVGTSGNQQTSSPAAARSAGADTAG
ncbi:MAG: helix-turn-helix domain-containing protein [Rubrivivax sp.]|nr:MAG: helix-turn-helix domain-containing protein [Rubrivivax sp.]